MLHFLTGLRSLPVAAALAGGIFLIDTLSSLHFAVASLYVIVVLIAAHDLDRRGVVITGVTCAFLTVFSYVIDHGFVVDGTAPLRSAVSLVSILIATMLVLRNVSAEEAYREAQLELAHANRVATMGQLTASIAHEIKQPIAAAHNNARAALNYLDNSPADVAEVREALTCIVDDADRASAVVDRIGSLIKKAPARKEVIDLNAAILEVIAVTRSEAVKAGVTVAAQLADELPGIRGDRVQLQQVMLNLIVNAIQSMRGVEGGNRELHISTVSIEPESVCVAVRDTGHGLRPESLPRLFEPFYTTKPDGMGMGLSICRSIIEAHGGRLWATSCEPRGALFQFTIPATRADGS